jgi:hypothetical protein
MYILSLKKVEITEQFRILHDEELGYLCRSHNVVRIVKCRRVRWAGHVAGMKGGGGTRDECRILFGKPLAKCSPGTQRIWEDNINMGFSEIGCEDGRWMELAQDRVQ